MARRLQRRGLLLQLRLSSDGDSIELESRIIKAESSWPHVKQNNNIGIGVAMVGRVLSVIFRLAQQNANYTVFSLLVFKMCTTFRLAVAS